MASEVNGEEFDEETVEREENLIDQVLEHFVSQRRVLGFLFQFKLGFFHLIVST